MQSSWYEPLRSIQSLGSQKEKIAHMGQLAEARRRHLGQFFTPDAVAKFMFSFVADLDVCDLLDNSIGSARLLQFADPTKHRLYGVDVHADTVDHVRRVVEEAGFECDIRCAGMQDINPRNLDCALINPPFSIHLESPFLESYPGVTRTGRFGPETSAISDEYAVMQALRACGTVIALLPRSSADAIRAEAGCWNRSEVHARLRAVFDLPPDTFKEENAHVLTSVLVFGEIRGLRKYHHIALQSLDDTVPDLGLAEAVRKHRQYKGKPKLGYRHLDASEPSITRPVTGDSTVIVSLDGRKINLAYNCGLTQAKVANAILHKQVFSTEHNRLPKGVKYAGQGKLDLEVYLLQEDPLQAFDAFIASIAAAGGKPLLRPGVRETVIRKIKRHRKAATPMRRTIWSRGATNATQVVGKARKTHNVDPTQWISPVVKAGETVQFSRMESGRFSYTKGDKTYEISADDLEARYFLEGAFEGWQVAHTGLRDAFPQEATMLRKRMAALGIDKWLSWDFQIQDAVEMLMRPHGAVCAWEQACGKSRVAAALILLSQVKHGLIVVESRLVDEMVGQLARVDIGADRINVIDSPERLTTLKQINIIAYERLRTLVDEKQSKRITYAHRLRRRIGLLLADEGERLANMESDQSRALFQVSARKRYIMTGTPIANFARDIHGVLTFTGGDGSATQPYGFRRGYIEKNWINSMEFAKRGLDAVRDDFVVLEWVSWEFADTLREGAKREIPKIANVERFRSWLAPHIKRRLTAEPEVEKFIQLPELGSKVIEVPWDKEHLAFYLKAADDFAQWYRDRGAGAKNNLAVLLAKLQAVQTALNAPQQGVGGVGSYIGMTSKQRAVLDFLVGAVDNGKKTLLYCENPSVVDLFHTQLQNEGIESVRFHGGIPIKKRVRDKDARFVSGNVPILLATKGSARAGYNLPMADYVVFADRSWSAKVESQAVRRPLRVERKERVEAVYFHLPGSLDIYQAQMVAFKSDSARAGLDYATPELDTEEFLHLSTILQSFVDDLAKVHGMRSYDMREKLKNDTALDLQIA